MEYRHNISENHRINVSRPYEFERDGTSSDSTAEKLVENTYLLEDRMYLKKRKFKNALNNRSLAVDILSILFGIGTWIGVNSTYVQLPILVEKAPEGWNLPSYLVVIIQFGNIGPLIYTILQKCCSNSKVKDSHLIYGVLVIGTVASIMMSFFYSGKATIGGNEYSIALFILVFFLALTGCTSSVLFMPYMGRFPETYLIMFFIGEGLSGFLPSVVSLIQGVGGNAECIPTNSTTGADFEKFVPPPRFGTEKFFMFIFTIMICSLLAFVLLENLKTCRDQYAAVKIGNGNAYEYEEPKSKLKQGKIVQRRMLSTFNYRSLLILMAVVCMFGNGVFPSLQSYSCLPYGNVAYHLAVSLSSMANPIACCLAIFLPQTSIRTIILLTVGGTVFTCYALITAFLSPAPPLVGLVIGEILIIFCWTVMVGLVSYIKLSITTEMRAQGGKSLVWVGAAGQIGSAIGSIITFVLVNYLHLFTSYQPC